VKRYAVISQPAAERDIGKACEWLAEQDEAAATRRCNRLLEVILSRDTFPKLCSFAPKAKFQTEEIRKFFCGHHQHKCRMLFKVGVNEVHVLHVCYSAKLVLGEDPLAER